MPTEWTQLSLSIDRTEFAHFSVTRRGAGWDLRVASRSLLSEEWSSDHYPNLSTDELADVIVATLLVSG